MHHYQYVRTRSLVRAKSVAAFEISLAADAAAGCDNLRRLAATVLLIYKFNWKSWFNIYLVNLILIKCKSQVRQDIGLQ